MTELNGVTSPAARHGCASCAVPRSLVEPKRKTSMRGGQEASESVLLLFGGERGKKPSLQLFSDVWMFDPDTLDCSLVGEAPASFTKRSYFTATYVDGDVWLVGGKTDDDIVSGDTVWVYDVREATWDQMAVEGDQNGRRTRRTAHGACVSPWDDRTIVIFGGYSVREQRGAWLSDVLEIDTRLDTSHPIRSPRVSFEKQYDEKFARAYMTIDAVDGVCVALFGRKGGKTVRDPCLLYDKKRELKVVKVSSKPVPRYNHRTSVCADGSLLACGGDLDGTLTVARYDAKRKVLDLETTLQLGVRKSHGQLADRVPRCATDGTDGTDGTARKGPKSSSRRCLGGSTEARVRLSLVGGYDLGVTGPEVDQVEVDGGNGGNGGNGAIVRTRSCATQSHANELRGLRKLLASRELELANKTQALEEAQQAVKEQKVSLATMERALEEQESALKQLNRRLGDKERELDAMANACTEERKERQRVSDRLVATNRELELLEQQRDMQELQFNSELERVHAEYVADLRKKNEQMRDMERSAATASEVARSALDKIQKDWAAEREARQAYHAKEIGERDGKLDELARENQALVGRLREELEATQAEAAARVMELQTAHEAEVAVLKREIDEKKAALERKDRENEDEKSRVRAALARITADLAKVQP